MLDFKEKNAVIFSYYSRSKKQSDLHYRNYVLYFNGGFIPIKTDNLCADWLKDKLKTCPIILESDYKLYLKGEISSEDIRIISSYREYRELE